MRDGTGRTTSEDRATQLLICEPLSFAIRKWKGKNGERMRKWRENKEMEREGEKMARE